MDVAENGDVYMGSENGVRRIRKGGGTGSVQDFTVSNSPLASNDVRAIAVDRATGKIWIGTADGLNVYDPGYRPPTPPAAEEALIVYPNPAFMNNLGVEIRLNGTSLGYAGGIYDLRGRLLHEFVTSTQGHVFWDGRDRQGQQVKPGVYFVRAQSGGGRTARGRFVLLH